MTCCFGSAAKYETYNINDLDLKMHWGKITYTLIFGSYLVWEWQWVDSWFTWCGKWFRHRWCWGLLVVLRRRIQYPSFSYTGSFWLWLENLQLNWRHGAQSDIVNTKFLHLNFVDSKGIPCLSDLQVNDFSRVTNLFMIIYQGLNYNVAKFNVHNSGYGLFLWSH